MTDLEFEEVEMVRVHAGNIKKVIRAIGAHVDPDAVVTMREDTWFLGYYDAKISTPETTVMFSIKPGATVVFLPDNMFQIQM